MKPETEIKIHKLTIQCLDILSHELKNPPKLESGKIDFRTILNRVEYKALTPYLKANPSHKTLVKHVGRNVMGTLLEAIKKANKEADQ